MNYGQWGEGKYNLNGLSWSFAAVMTKSSTRGTFGGINELVRGVSGKTDLVKCRVKCWRIVL